MLEAQEESGLGPEYSLVAVASGQLILTSPSETFVERVTWENDVAVGCNQRLLAIHMWYSNEVPPSPLTAEEVFLDEEKLLARGIAEADIWQVLRSGPRVLRNKRGSRCCVVDLRPRPQGRLLRINVYWLDEEERILRVTSGWPV